MPNENTTGQELPTTNEVVDLPTATAEVTATPAVKPIPVNKAGKLTKRTMEELDGIVPHKMNENEKNDYIKHLREQVVILTAKNDGLDHNAKQAYEKMRLFQDAFQAKSERMQKNNAFIAQALDVCQKSILNLIREDK